MLLKVIRFLLPTATQAKLLVAASCLEKGFHSSHMCCFVILKRFKRFKCFKTFIYSIINSNLLEKQSHYALH